MEGVGQRVSYGMARSVLGFSRLCSGHMELLLVVAVEAVIYLLLHKQHSTLKHQLEYSQQP